MTRDRRRIVLAGNPNSGKTTLFNALTGASARTGNYPGITVEATSAQVTWGETDLTLLDVPGAYSLSATSADEVVAADAILPRDGKGPDLVVAVVDMQALDRHLYLVHQLLETPSPLILVLNFADEAEEHGVRVDAKGLGLRLGVPCVAISARRRTGIDALKDACLEALTRPSARPSPNLPAPIEGALEPVRQAVRATWPQVDEQALSALARWVVLSLGEDELEVPSMARAAVEKALAEHPGLDEQLIRARYANIERWVQEHVERRPPSRTRTDLMDAWLTHPIAGIVTFALVMFVVFQALLTWSAPLVEGIEAVTAQAQALVRSWLPAGPLEELLADGVLAGVGNVLVFVPQIAMLSLFIAILEDSGYLARVAFVIDRVMRGAGLHGRAFVPLLSGIACAVPAILATRTIESRRDRLATMLALPFMSCSARLPVYALMIAVIFPAGATLGGIPVGPLVLLAMYALSVVATLAAVAILRRTVLRGPTPALILELPPYRLPDWRSVARNVLEKTWSFIASAGSVIAALTIVLWALLNYPRDAEREAAFEAQLASASETERPQLESLRAEHRMEHSIAGHLGHLMEPALEPLGFDWKIGIGLVASFAAREVLVGTLGIVYGVGEVDEGDASLQARLREARRSDGRPLFTPVTGLALMVFFVLAAQCMSTIATLRRESGSWRWALFVLVWMNAVAYAAAFVVVQVGHALGYS